MTTSNDYVHHGREGGDGSGGDQLPLGHRRGAETPIREANLYPAPHYRGPRGLAQGNAL